jgi:purine-binding chemotaxis protein CheW
VQDSGQREKYLEGIAKLPNSEGVIIVLDMAKLLTPSEIMRLPGRAEPATAATEAPPAPEKP